VYEVKIEATKSDGFGLSLAVAQSRIKWKKVF